jgi:hypothetical protein
LIDGVPSQPFSAVTLPPQAKKTPHKSEIIALSRTRYAKPRRQVEQEILFAPPRPPSGPTQRRLV